jgi:hypothetical protein
VRRHRLGDWTCPSGNNCIAYYVGGQPPTVLVAWDSPPPFSREDQAYYDAVIQPALVARITEYTEQLGRGLVVKL